MKILFVFVPLVVWIGGLYVAALKPRHSRSWPRIGHTHPSFWRTP